MTRRVSRGAFVAGFLLFFVASGTFVLFLGATPFPRAVEQPIAFNHRKHVEEHEISCSTCHLSYEEETFSGLPDAEVCAFCHLEAQGTSAEELKLVDLLAGGAALDWKPLFRQPPHVFYSHRRHVAVAGLECSVCHGSIGESESPPGRVTPLRMSDCVECHRRSGASTTCTACHR